MPRSHLLDTSVYSQPVRRSMNPIVASRMEAIEDETVVVAAICEAEVLYGIRKHGSPQMRERFELLLRGRFTVLPVDSDVAATYAELRTECESLGVTVAPMDLLIAATAKTHNLKVATLNYRDFARIPGLVVEDWSQPPAPPSQ